MIKTTIICSHLSICPNKPKPIPKNNRYEGKSKILYETNVANELIQFFKDDATAHNAQKLEIINSKGIINNYISEYIMNFLGKKGIDNHFIKRVNSREQLIRKVKIIPIKLLILIKCIKLNLRLINLNYQRTWMVQDFLMQFHI